MNYERYGHFYSTLYLHYILDTYQFILYIQFLKKKREIHWKSSEGNYKRKIQPQELEGVI